jgi:hypothetical protein
MLRSSGDGVESQVMTTTEIAKLALLISGHLSDMTAAEIVNATEELAKRLDDLPGPAELWSYQARDAALAVVREIHEDRKRREMAIPRIAATECDPFDTTMGSVVAAMVWALACSHSRDDAVRGIAARMLQCDPDELRVRAELAKAAEVIGLGPDSGRCGFIREPAIILYTVTWPRGRSTCILRNVVQP